MALYHFTTKPLSRGSRNTVGAIAYRAGCKLYDSRTVETFNYESKPVQHVELVLPQDAPVWARNIQKLIAEDRQKGVQAFVDVVEGAETRINSRVWREFEFALHRELNEEQNMALARAFVEEQFALRGMAPLLNFYFDVNEETGEYKPHCHATIPTRRLSEGGMGEKEREWNAKSLLFDLREQWANYSNFYLKLYGHDLQIDHRSNKERGIELEPQPKLGRGVREQEKRLQQLEGSGGPITDKARLFHETQLRNLYRIMRKPDVVFDIVTKHHATFMWEDVRRVLHRYVDEMPLFQRLESKLRNSNELLLLRSDEKYGDVYTTHTMLKAEKALIETAESLNQVKSHGVEVGHIEHGIEKANKTLEDKGGLSEDQVKAIHHLTEEGQIKCVVGIAGAEKTTALGVCHDVWKAEGYAVYGLAPTGKASQNLEQSGIPSMTVHKFLKSFEEGRFQYNEKSALVLDEAGMVDVERFGKLLAAVQHLGVKLIVVGDGAQLQPVEAGPAFRLVTERLGKSELNAVIRQKEEWQKEATVLFGQQRTAEAIEKYLDKGCVHIVEEKLPLLHEALVNKDEIALSQLYQIARRVSSLMYREMARDCSQQSESGYSYDLIKQHPDFRKYREWKTLEEQAKSYVSETYKDQKAGVRQTTKESLIKEWHASYLDSPEKTNLILAYSNKDVKDLNHLARTSLKETGHLSKEEFTYTIKMEVEDDFGRTRILQERKGFSKGDRIVFTRNNDGLGVKNGTMGTITTLGKQTIQVKLDEGGEISFAPKLNPYFDQGWAITIHKSQGITVDKTYVLASYEMTRNLAYVSMTRHREEVKVYGSSLDFWRPEKLPDVLSKSGEKLSAADYLDPDSLNKLMQKEDKLLTKIFDRISNELEAMRAVTKQAFRQVADHFLGTQWEKEISNTPGGIREEVRAEEVLKKEGVSKQPSLKENHAPDKDVFNEIVNRCEQHLYQHIAKENISLTPERQARIPIQAEKAANFIFHAHTLKGTTPTEGETKLYLLRAKYELDRIPGINQKLTEQWQRKGSFDEKKEPLLIHMIAERQAGIEGRLYWDAKRDGRDIPSNIKELGEKEFTQHRSQTKELAQQLSEKHSLTESAATHCAKDILRYKETHGENLTPGQIDQMVHISRELETKYDTPFAKETGSHNLEYTRRMEADSLLRTFCFQHRESISMESRMEHTRPSLEHSPSSLSQDLERVQQKQKEMTL